jgi:hypothetical protein
MKVTELTRALLAERRRQRDEGKTINRNVYLGELPPGDWKFATLGNAVIAVNPDHQPRMIANGKVTVIDPSETAQ